jgi:hypothetical protein
MDIPFTQLGLDLSWGSVISIIVVVSIFFFGRANLISRLEKKKLTKKKAHQIAISLNYIGGLLLIFSSLPTANISVGGAPLLASFLPTYFGLLPIMLAFELEKALAK